MRILIFGPTGGVGRHLVEQALDRGHSVTAFARSPTTLDIRHATPDIVQGNVMDLAAVKRAMPGHEAVLTALGSPPWRNTTVRSDGNRHVIRAMESVGVQRLVSLSTLGIGDSWAVLPLKYKVLFRTVLRKAFAAHERQEQYITQSQLDWTIVRPGAYTDGGRTREYKHGFPPTDETITAEISRADVADFMLNQLEDATYLRQTPGVSY